MGQLTVASPWTVHVHSTIRSHVGYVAGQIVLPPNEATETHSAPISTQLAVAWYFLLNCALAPIQWVTRPCPNTWAPKPAVADFRVKSEEPEVADPLTDMTSLELANACKSNRRPRRVPSVRTTPVDHRSRRSVSSARSSSTPSSCSSGSDGKCTASRTAGTRVELMAAAILRQLDECELLSLQGVSPSRFAMIHKLSMGGARAITRRAHLIVPQNADLQFMCRNAADIVALCGPSRRARHQTRGEASFTAGDPTPPSTGLVRPWYVRSQRFISACYTARVIQARVRWWLEHRRQQHRARQVAYRQERIELRRQLRRIHQIHASAACLQAQVRSWLARRGLQRRVAAAV